MDDARKGFLAGLIVGLIIGVFGNDFFVTVSQRTSNYFTADVAVSVGDAGECRGYGSEEGGPGNVYTDCVNHAQTIIKAACEQLGGIFREDEFITILYEYGYAWKCEQVQKQQVDEGDVFEVISGVQTSFRAPDGSEASGAGRVVGTHGINCAMSQDSKQPVGQCLARVPSGANMHLTVEPSEGWTLDHWGTLPMAGSCPCVGSKRNDCSFTVHNDDVGCIAWVKPTDAFSFELSVGADEATRKSLSIQWWDDGEEELCLPQELEHSCNYSIKKGAEVTLTAYPRSLFDYWYTMVGSEPCPCGEKSTKNPCTFTIDKSGAGCTALVSRGQAIDLSKMQQFTLLLGNDTAKNENTMRVEWGDTVETCAPATEEEACTYSIPYGKQVKVTAQPSAGQVFRNRWIDTYGYKYYPCPCLGTSEQTCEFYIEKDLGCKVFFEEG